MLAWSLLCSCSSTAGPWSSSICCWHFQVIACLRCTRYSQRLLITRMMERVVEVLRFSFPNTSKSKAWVGGMSSAQLLSHCCWWCHHALGSRLASSAVPVHSWTCINELARCHSVKHFQTCRTTPGSAPTVSRVLCGTAHSSTVYVRCIVAKLLQQLSMHFTIPCVMWCFWLHRAPDATPAAGSVTAFQCFAQQGCPFFLAHVVPHRLHPSLRLRSF